MEQTEAQLALPRAVQMVVLQEAGRVVSPAWVVPQAVQMVVLQVEQTEAGQVAFPALEAPQAVQKVVQPVPLQVVVLVKSPE